MSQEIKDFYNQAQSKDFARNFQFRIIQMPGGWNDDTQLVYLETATLPGRQIANIGVPFMGLQFNVPGTASYPGSDSWSVTFRCDQNYDIRKILENQTFNTFDEKVSGGTYKMPNASSIVSMQLVDKNFAALRTYNLIGAYVVSIGNTSYDIGDNGSIVKVEATLAYQYWTVV
jgi:hypothetical protein